MLERGTLKISDDDVRLLHDAHRMGWRWQLANALDGSRFVAMPEGVQRCVARYPVLVTPYYLSLADLSDSGDPIAKQCLPDAQEWCACDGELEDPFGEETAPLPGLVHRFPDRVLVMGAKRCAVMCRHCTRKNMLGRCQTIWEAGLDRMVDYLRVHTEVREVLLSGGDSLLLEDEPLRRLLDAVLAVASVEVIRIGTRVPVVMPMRIDDALIATLKRAPSLWVNTQFNHPVELTSLAIEACGRLVDAGIPVSNQSVLLRGVNDSEETMVALCAALQRARVRPYYVFLCDPVIGTGHFRVAVRRAREIERALETRLGGLALPRFVADVPGSLSKVQLARV